MWLLRQGYTVISRRASLGTFNVRMAEIKRRTGEDCAEWWTGRTVGWPDGVGGGHGSVKEKETGGGEVIRRAPFT